jgi:hypothetical protein
VVQRGRGAPYSNFNPAWAGGTKIFIAGSAPACNANLCTIASVRDATHLTILENLTISDASWSSADFGLLIRKTTGAGAVSVSAGYQFAYSSMYNSGLDGSGDICNSNPVTVRVDAAGDPISASQQGYLCVMNATALSQILTPIYLFIPATGETRLLARNYQVSTNDYTQWVGWHPTDGASWFTHRFGTSYFKTTYLGDFRALTPGYIQNNVESASPEQLSFSDIFAGTGNDVISQIANCRMNVLCDSGINSAVFKLPPSPPQTGAAIRGSYMVLCGNAGAQDSPGYVTYWDIGNIPARLTWAAYTWDRYPVGYGGIHGCQSFGTGRFNLISLNAQLGQVGGNEMTGPWQATPIMVDATGTGYVSNTLVKPADGFYCPAGLDAKWQEIGAAPRAQGGLPLCVKIKIPGEPCSSHASAVESANFPCPWNSTSNFSMLKALGEGDTIHDARYGFVTYGENMLVVKKVVNSTRDIELTVFRYRLSPRANYACGSVTDAEMTHLSGWTMQMAPFESCAGGNYWTDALDPARRWFTETLQISGVHSDFGLGSSGYSFIGGAQLDGYHTRADQPMPQQIGRLPTARISANPKFGSTQLPDTFLQTYPSKRQQFAPISEMDWALDIRHYNPPVGNPPEITEGLFGNILTRVSGASNTYRISFPGNQTPDLKHTGFIGWAGWHQLADKSGPASSLDDSDSWHYCFAYNAGECVRGSSAGETYVSVPQAETSVPCQVNSYAANAPCISNNYPYGFWVLQFDASRDDPNGLSSRRLASMFVAPGRQYNFTNAKPTPDGKWAIAQAEWLEGQRTDMYWIKLPPFPPRASFRDASGAPPLKLQITGAPGDSIRIAFGYAENGNPSDFYCTTRKEACYTSATATPANPFLFAGEAQSYTPCSPTCNITIPAIHGRVMYYRVEPSRRTKSVTSAPRVVAVE